MFEEDWDGEEEKEEMPRDPAVDLARKELVKFFKENPDGVFYGRQIEVLFEKPFFHWITKTAVSELAEEGIIHSWIEELVGKVEIRFYRSHRNRYWKRQAERIKELVSKFSDPKFGFGQQAEMLFDSAFMGIGFSKLGSEVRAHKGLEWNFSGHNLDRIYAKDGLEYGVEIKNRLQYIERGELEIKTLMCKALGLTPLFIMRFAPKSYMHQVIQNGGFALLFKEQFYPFGQDELVQAVREELKLPVSCPRAVPEGDVNRFLKWHEKRVRGLKGRGK